MIWLILLSGVVVGFFGRGLAERAFLRHFYKTRGAAVLHGALSDALTEIARED